MSSYTLHAEAFSDIDQLWEYIAEHNIDAADRVVADIFATLRTLAASPNIGHRRPDRTARPLRFHLVRDYLIAYAPDESPCGSWRFSTGAAIRASWPRFFEDGERKPVHMSAPTSPHQALKWSTL